MARCLHLDEIKRQRLLTEGKQPLCQGQPAGIGVAVGLIVLDALRRKGLPQRDVRW